MSRFSALTAVFLLGICMGNLRASDPLDSAGQTAEGIETLGQAVEFKAPLAGARDRVRIVRTGDGSTRVIVERKGAGTDRLLTAEEFLTLLYDQGTGKNWITRILNVSSYGSIAWVVLGLLGQAIFAGRMLVQWIVSESEGRSVIPVSFWWMSVIGSTMLLVYFIWRRDIVGVLGQATGWVIYLRNLLLIHRARNGLPSSANRTTTRA